MSAAVHSLTAQCGQCGADIRRDSKGKWRDRIRAIPDPYSCVGGKPHEPASGTLR